MGRRSRAPPAASLGSLWGVGGFSLRADRSRVAWTHLASGAQPPGWAPQIWPPPVASSNLAVLLFKLHTSTGVRTPLLGLHGVGGGDSMCSMLLIASSLCGCKSTCPRYDYLPGYAGAVPSFGWRHNQQRRAAAWDGRRSSKAAHIVTLS